MPRPILATIDTQALAFNYDRVKSLIRQAPAFAVVKADAYGHGLLAAYRGFAKADGFALIEIENAIRLREQGCQKPILLLEGAYSAIDWRAAAEHRLACTLHCDEQLSEFEATPVARKVDIYLKLNTGMNRLGFSPERVRDLLARLTSNASVGNITLMSHFACADERDGHLEQLRLFNDATAGLPFARSIANSAACFDFDRVALPLGQSSTQDWARPGIMLYGATPFSHATRSAASLQLSPAMTLSSEVIAIQTLKAGDAIGYGAAYRASKEGERIAIVACGYADGYPRHAPTGTPVLVNAARATLVGRVSMDKIAVDVSTVPSAQVGSPVELWGKQLPVDEVAAAAGTIGYELLTAVAARVSRKEI